MKKYSLALLFAGLLSGIIYSNVNAQRITVTVAGNGTAGYTGDGSSAIYAAINNPQDVCLDAANNLYFVDKNNNRVRKVSGGVINTIAGGGSSTSDGVPATTASITPNYMCIDASGNIYITTANKIRKINAVGGTISTIAGTSLSGFSGDGGPATAALLSNPTGICIDASGNLYFVDRGNNRVRKINALSGTITTIAGSSSTSGYTGDGGPATVATLGSPACICLNAAGDVYFSDQNPAFPLGYDNSVIRKITASTGIVTTIAGAAPCTSTSGVPALHATLGTITGMCCDDSGNVHTCEMSCSCREIQMSSGMLILEGGNFGIQSFSDDITSPLANMNHPFGICIDHAGTIYIADGFNNRIRKLIQLTNKPSFAFGQTQFITPCPGSVYQLSSPLSVTDYDSTHTETWSVLSTPAHGVLSGFPLSMACVGTNTTTKPTGLTYTPSGTYLGTDAFQVRVTDGTHSDTVTINASVQVASPGTISGPTHICAGSATTLTETVPGGNWTVTNSNALVGLTTGALSALIAGIDTVIYTTVTPCAVTTTFVITINPVPATGVISGLDTVCAGSTITLTESVSGGLWSSLTPALATVGSSTGIVTGTTDGSASIKYTVSNTWCTANTTKPVYVNSPAGPLTGGDPIVCIGSSTTFTDADPGGSWSLTNPSALITGGGSSYVTITAITTGIDTIVYTNTNSCGTATVTQVVTLNPAPSTGTISGPSSLCYTGTITLTSTVSGGYWITSNTNAYIDGYSGLLTGVTPGTDSVIYTVSTGGACTASTAILVTIDSIADPGAITGSGSVCISTPITLTESVTGGTWSATNTNATVSSAGLVTGITPGIDTIIYSVTNACGTAIAAQAIMIDPCGELGNTVSAVTPGINIFPNPAAQTINIKWNGLQQGNVEYSMSDVTGRIVASFTLPNGSGTGSLHLNIADIEDGVYFISIHAGTNHYINKLVVAR